jgi:alkyl hydroperoxide reductase subunit AhpC
MALWINSEAPNFTAETTQGKINFHDWIGNGWAILFSHPKDFTPVCTTELGYMAGLKPEFDKRNCKILGLSVDPVTDHERWSKDIQDAAGHAVTLVGGAGKRRDPPAIAAFRVSFGCESHSIRDSVHSRVAGR